jgi:DNA-binding MarR family transcriptional regulator
MDTLKIKSIAKPIIITATRMETFATSHVLKPVGLSLPSIKILHVLNERSEMMPIEIMRVLGSTKSNITQRLNSLEKKGLVERYFPAGIADRRRIMLRLTVAGRKKLSDAVRAIDEKSVDLEKFFSREELKNHFAFFKKLNTILDSCEK